MQKPQACFSRFVYSNANYWGGAQSGDCIVRAISAAFNIGYIKTCQIFHGECIIGHGLKPKSFSQSPLKTLRAAFVKTGHLEQAYSNTSILSSTSLDKNSPEAISLDGFMKSYNNSGRYIVILKDQFHPSSNILHAVYVNTASRTVFDTKDSRHLQVYLAFKILTKKLDPSDKFSRQSEVASLDKSSSSQHEQSSSI